MPLIGNVVEVDELRFAQQVNIADNRHVKFGSDFL